MYTGIDGCKKGWIAIEWSNNKYSYSIHEKLAYLLSKKTIPHRILIDMPIGLSTKGHLRTIDSTLRNELKPRHATVFNAPCREALYIDDHQAAKLKNIEIENKSLSIQTLNIRDKIKEIDQILLKNGTPHQLLESHPELCFKYLNPSQKVVLSKKSTKTGIQERLHILSLYDSSIVKLYEKIMKEVKRKDAKSDDIIDAICLCLVNKMAGIVNLNFLNPLEADDNSIPMNIAYYNPLKQHIVENQ
jgi:8-oxo-dGTP diphosphatase